MPSVSKETASETIALDGLEVRLEHLDGGYSVCFESHTADGDLGGLFRGLPDDRCQLPRWGYVITGKVAFRLADRERDLPSRRRLLRAAGPYAHPLRRGRARRVQPDGRPRADDSRGAGEPACGRSRGQEPGMNYRLAYAIGFHPWEDLAEHPPFADRLLELVSREEARAQGALWSGARPRHRQRGLGGPARAAGLAGDRRRHRREGPAPRRRAGRRDGRRAASRARRRDGAATVGCRFGLPADARHGHLPRPRRGQRQAMGREVSAIAAPDATLLLDCFAPRPERAAAARREPRRRRGGLPRMGGDRRRGRGHPARRPRTTLQVRRALLPAPPQRNHGVTTRCALR